MTLIVEDGSIVDNANTFVNLVDARAVAVSYGLALPVGDAEAENAMKTGAKWVKSQEGALQGSRVSPNQLLSYPRNDVYLYGYLISNSTIPTELIESQVVASVAAGNGESILTPMVNNRLIKKEKMDDLGEVEYFSGGSSKSESDNIRLAKSILKPLTNLATSAGGGLLCVRV